MTSDMSVNGLRYKLPPDPLQQVPYNKIVGERTMKLSRNDESKKVSDYFDAVRDIPRFFQIAHKVREHAKRLAWQYPRSNLRHVFIQRRDRTDSLSCVLGRVDRERENVCYRENKLNNQPLGVRNRS